jgi:hypothetical protein
MLVKCLDSRKQRPRILSSFSGRNFSGTDYFAGSAKMLRRTRRTGRRDRETELHLMNLRTFPRRRLESHFQSTLQKHTLDNGYCSRPRFRNCCYCLLRMQYLNLLCDNHRLTSDFTGSRRLGSLQALPWWHQRRRQGLLQGRLRTKDDQKGSRFDPRDHVRSSPYPDAFSTHTQELTGLSITENAASQRTLSARSTVRSCF